MVLLSDKVRKKLKLLFLVLDEKMKRIRNKNTRRERTVQDLSGPSVSAVGPW